MTEDAPHMPVLVADDETQLLELCRRVLGREGYEVLTARNGDEAVRAFAARRAEVRAVVMDATLSPAGAAAACREILKLGDNVGVVVTSGADLDAPLRQLLSEHRGVFLRKPFPPAALVRAVADVQMRGVG